jgi:hypothetical protein
VRRLGVGTRAFVALVALLALLAAGTALSFAVVAGATPLGSLADTTTEPVSTQPEPAPDPAPAPKPAAKPAPKPTAKVTRPAPTLAYRAPTRTYSTPSYTPLPSRATTRSTKHRVVRKHKQHKAKKPAATKPAPTTAPEPALVTPVRVGAMRGPVDTAGEGVVTGALFVVGVTFAALLFLLAAAVPGTPVRFTPAGRVVIEHQQDFVLVGIAALVISAFVYVLTGHGL